MQTCQRPHKCCYRKALQGKTGAHKLHYAALRYKCGVEEYSDSDEALRHDKHQQKKIRHYHKQEIFRQVIAVEQFIHTVHRRAEEDENEGVYQKVIARKLPRKVPVIYNFKQFKQFNIFHIYTVTSLVVKRIILAKSARDIST